MSLDFDPKRQKALAKRVSSNSTIDRWRATIDMGGGLRVADCMSESAVDCPKERSHVLKGE